MKRIFLLLFLGSVLYGCSKSNAGGGTITTPTCEGTKSFATDVNPIIQSTCAISGCHAAGSFNGPGPLTSYAQISAIVLRFGRLSQMARCLRLEALPRHSGIQSYVG